MFLLSSPFYYYYYYYDHYISLLQNAEVVDHAEQKGGNYWDISFTFPFGHSNYKVSVVNVMHFQA